MAASSSPDAWVVEDASQQKLPAQYIAAALERVGMRVRCLDWNASAERFVADVLQAQPRLVVFSVLFANRLDEYLSSIAQLRAAGVRAHLTMAGHLPALAYAEILNACPGLDSVICGEPEPIAAQLARGLGEPSDWNAIPGLACRRPEPLLDSSAQFGDLDDLAPPLHMDPLPSFRGMSFATIQASRGCYHTCTFCLPRAFYRRHSVYYRMRRIGSLVDEIEALYQRGVRLFLFDDEQFLAPLPVRESRIHALATELERRKLQIAFTLKCRADDVDPSLLTRLKEMGLIRVYVGVESGCAATLDCLGKGVTVRQNADALAVLDELGIVADFGCLLFHPWSTLETIQAEIAFLRQVLPHVPTVFNFWEIEVYPGTSMAERLLLERQVNSSAGRLGYVIGDVRAEMLRQLNRAVFNPGLVDWQNALTQDWFDYLLAQRFQPSTAGTTRADTFKQTAARVNSTALDIWEELVRFAEQGDEQNAAHQNAVEFAARARARLEGVALVQK